MLAGRPAKRPPRNTRARQPNGRSSPAASFAGQQWRREVRIALSNALKRLASPRQAARHSHSHSRPWAPPFRQPQPPLLATRRPPPPSLSLWARRADTQRATGRPPRRRFVPPWAASARANGPSGAAWRAAAAAREKRPPIGARSPPATGTAGRGRAGGTGARRQQWSASERAAHLPGRATSAGGALTALRACCSLAARAARARAQSVRPAAGQKQQCSAVQCAPPVPVCGRPALRPLARLLHSAAKPPPKRPIIHPHWRRRGAHTSALSASLQRYGTQSPGSQPPAARRNASTAKPSPTGKAAPKWCAAAKYPFGWPLVAARPPPLASSQVCHPSSADTKACRSALSGPWAAERAAGRPARTVAQQVARGAHASAAPSWTRATNTSQLFVFRSLGLARAPQSATRRHKASQGATKCRKAPPKLPPSAKRARQGPLVSGPAVRAIRCPLFATRTPSQTQSPAAHWASKVRLHFCAALHRNL